MQEPVSVGLRRREAAACELVQETVDVKSAVI